MILSEPGLSANGTAGERGMRMSVVTLVLSRLARMVHPAAMAIAAPRARRVPSHPAATARTTPGGYGCSGERGLQGEGCRRRSGSSRRSWAQGGGVACRARRGGPASSRARTARQDLGRSWPCRQGRGSWRAGAARRARRRATRARLARMVLRVLPASAARTASVECPARSGAAGPAGRDGRDSRSRPAGRSWREGPGRLLTGAMAATARTARRVLWVGAACPASAATPARRARTALRGWLAPTSNWSKPPP